MKKAVTYIWLRKWLLALVVVVFIGIVWYAFARSGGAKYQFVTVTRGTITETVSVTGNTTSTKSVSLGFQTAGTIANVSANLGDKVYAGEVLASLDTSDLRAQLLQANAAVDSAQAQLDKLIAGPRPENISVAQTALVAAQQNLTNTYAGISNTLADANTKSIDAVVNQLAPFFSNPQGTNPQLTFTISDSQLLNNIQTERAIANQELTLWQAELAATSTATDPATLDATLASAQKHLDVMKTLVNQAAQALISATNLSATTAATYKTDATTAQNEVNAAATEVTTATQTIASQKAAVAQAQAQLNLTSASSTPEDILAQRAQVEQAQANAASIEAKIRQASIVSPINGTITMQNAKIGQVASPSNPLISIIADSGFEVDAYVPEVDIGKLAVGDPVSMTLDAFPGETFTGNVFYINSAETVISGVVDYLVKVSFEKPDPRIKSGLTVNCTITAETKSGVLILPQYAVLQNDQGTFVKTLDAKKNAVQEPVTLGIQDDQGNVEIASGVAEGEQVINIGLK